MLQVLHDASQESVYETCARDLVAQLMRGYNATLLAYGETGAGENFMYCTTRSVFLFLNAIIPQARRTQCVDLPVTTRPEELFPEPLHRFAIYGVGHVHVRTCSSSDFLC